MKCYYIRKKTIHVSINGEYKGTTREYFNKRDLRNDLKIKYPKAKIVLEYDDLDRVNNY
jgi:hypothetical protein